MGGHGPASTQLSLMERALEAQMTESLEESKALREKFQDDLDCLREDSERRLVERNNHAKKQQAKLKEHTSRIDREKAELVQQAELLQEQLIGSTREVCLARERIFQLEAEAQSMRSRPPQVIERADPGAAVEIMRLRDRTIATEEQARRAQRAAAEAREAGFQRNVDGARHRLLTVQASLAEVSEENAGLRRELESERIKTAAGSRRLEETVQRQENALAAVRSDSTQLREQRDRLAQDSAILGIKLHQSKKREAARRLFHALSYVAQCSLATALRALVAATMSDIHSNKQARQQEEHASEVASLETDVHRVETRCRDALRRIDRLLESRETVASLAVQAYRRRRQGTIFAAVAAEEDSARTLAVAQRWCFWGWARVAHSGSAAVTRRARRAEAEKEIAGVREMLSAAVEKTRGAEAERNRQGARAEALAEEIRQRNEELEVARTAVNATRSVASCMRSRSGRLGATRLQKTLEQNRRFRVAQAFAALARIRNEVHSDTPSPPREDNGASVSRHKDSATVCAKCTGTGYDVSEEAEGAQPQPEVPRARGTCITSQGHGRNPAPTVSNMVQDGSSSAIGFGARSIEVDIDTQDNCEETAHLALPIPKRSGPAHDDPPTKNLHSGVKFNGSIEDPEQDEGGIDKVVAKTVNTVVPFATNSGDHSALHHHYRDPSSSRVAPISTPIQPIREQSSVHDCGTPMHTRDPSIGGFPPPVRKFKPASTILPSPSTTRHTKDTSSVSCGNGSSGIAGPLTTPVSDSSSGWSAIPLSPRAVLTLRAAVGQELYGVGERLLRCVEADHREVHGRLYRAIRITRAEREQFHVCLEDASRGSLRCAVITFLKVQESCRAIGAERDRGDGVESRGGRTGGGGSRDGFPGARRKRKDNPDTGEQQHDVSSLTTGPLSSPAEKARAARVLRDRLVSLLDDADEAWSRHRRPWERMRHISGTRKATTTCDLRRSERKTTDGISAKKATKMSVNADRRLHRGKDGKREPPSPHARGKFCYLDSGGGPRTFWETVAGPRLVEAGWAMNVEALEQQLWDLAMLVRCRDKDHRAHGGRPDVLALNRCERLRRILDIRIYELLLMHVRTRLIWEGIDINDDDEDDHDQGGECISSTALLEVSGDFRHRDSSVVPSAAGCGWPASAAP